MFFVFLQVMMRSMSMKYCAVLLALWYLMSIIGFNVHICHSAHHDVHHNISHVGDHQDCCCHHEKADPEISFSCCTDEYHVLSLSGMVSSNENDVEQSVCADSQIFAGYIPDVCISFNENRIHKIRSLPDSGLIAGGDVQSVLSIWRI